ncbi:hypothetical protein ACOMHN_035685 [Nucella lapillus]
MASESSSERRRNLESSILFIQQEQAATLKALHEEIHKLQSKCTDLTFQLTINGVNVEENGDADSRLTEIHSQLTTSQSQKSLLESQLSGQNQKIQQLTQELRTLKKRHLDETRDAEQTISGLKAEVEAKGSNIAYLTSELHRLKLAPGAEPLDPATAGKVDPRVKAKPRPSPQYSHLPTPPRDLLTNSARMHQRGATLATAPRSGVRRVGALTAACVASASNPPDIRPFMQRDLDMAVTAVEVKKPAPLPPIAGSRSAVKERELHRVVLSKGGKLTRAMVPEVATLAVDQINDVSWKRPSQPHSCEHN